MMKSRLYKLDSLTHTDLIINIKIPKEKYKNIIKGTYKRPDKYIKKVSNRISITHFELGVLNVKRCKK